MRGKRVLGIGTIFVAVLAGAAPVNAGIDPGAQYVALGDSFTAGPLIPNQYGRPRGCRRSDRNYPALVAARKRLRLTDVSCAGARIRDMTAPQTTKHGVNPPQLDALTPDTGLVTLGIGGNDVGFGAVALACGLAGLGNPMGAPCTARYGNALKERARRLGPRIAEVLRRIRARSPGARVLVVGYLRLLPGQRGCWPAVPVARGDVAFLDGLERELNGVLSEQARANGAGFVDTYEGGEGHDMCAPAQRKWVEGILLSHPAAPVHPNAAGMREVAGRVLGTLSAASHAGAGQAARDWRVRAMRSPR